MFNFQGSEVIIILLLALVVLGPEKLPDAMRKLGRFYGDLKKMSSGFQEEFRAVVDEPMRELRDTANTIRDSVDFRKLQDGERDEKPKSADMAPVEPASTPTTDVPFRPDESSIEHPVDTPDDTSDDAAVEPAEPAERAASSPTPHPTPPPPFSSSQASSAAVPRPRVAEEPTGDEPSADDAPGPLGPQVAVDDEHGLREARPVEDGAA